MEPRSKGIDGCSTARLYQAHSRGTQPRVTELSIRTRHRTRPAAVGRARNAFASTSMNGERTFARENLVTGIGCW
jgi:hypothetical protein